jgi:hypothetical protein
MIAVAGSIMVLFGISDGVLILLLILNCVTDIVNVSLLAYTVLAPVHAVNVSTSRNLRKQFSTPGSRLNHAIHLHLPQR